MEVKMTMEEYKKLEEAKQDYEILKMHIRQCAEIKEEYEYYFGDEECNELQSDCVDDITINKTILSIVNKYVNKHPIGKTIGAEYVAQDDEAQEEAQEMFEKIMEYYASLEE